jgi:hypothetical protein
MFEEDVMNQDHYEFISQIHRQQYEFIHRQKELKSSSPGNLTLRERSLLYLSDLMLNLGQRIRPAEFSVRIHSLEANDGTLEITAKGC